MGARRGGVGGCCGAGMNIGGTLGSVTFPLAIWVASLEWVCVAIVGSMGECQIASVTRSSMSDCDSSLCDSESVLGDAG